jgi:hypothetical protein
MRKLIASALFLASVSCATAGTQEEAGFTPIFNGKDLETR